MTPATGYYSLIQFCPDLSRLEVANVGVLLFSPQHGFLKAITSRHNRRIQQFFGREGHDWARINSFKRAIEERLEIERPSITTVEDLEQFIARRANRFQITSPRPMRVTDPDRDLQRLFQELVGGEPRLGRQESPGAFVHRQLAEAGLLEKVRRDIRVRVPTFDREVEIPYGYQNGRFNLIQPARFQAPEPANVITTACRYAVEGRSLYEHPDPDLGELQLVVVGLFPPAQSDSQSLVRKILGENHVDLVPAAEIDRLLTDIRKNAKQLTAGT